MRDAIAFLKRISGQITALVMASIITLHLVVTTVFLLHQPDVRPPLPRDGQPFLEEFRTGQLSPGKGGAQRVERVTRAAADLQG